MNKAFAPEKSSPDRMKQRKRPEEKGSESKSGAKRLRKKISARYLENSGAYYLQRFTASISQFRRVMQRKIELSCRDHPDQNKDACLKMLDELVEKFTSLGYLNDTAYAQGLVYSLTQRGFSRQRVLHTMRLKGLADAEIEAALPPADDAHELLMALRFCRKKRIGPFLSESKALRAEADPNAQNKYLAALARAGFPYDLAKRAIEFDALEAEDLLNA